MTDTFHISNKTKFSDVQNDFSVNVKVVKKQV